MPDFIVKVLSTQADEYHETASTEIKAAFLAGLEAQETGEYDDHDDETLVVTVELAPPRWAGPQSPSAR